MKHLNNKKGFTLIELMIVVVIIIVLIAIAGTTWLLSLNHLSLRNDTSDIASALKKAKQGAVTGRPYQVYFDIANEVYQIEDCNLDAGGNIDLVNGNNCNIPAAAFFTGSGSTHGTIVGSLKDLRIASFGHKPINLDSILDGDGNAANMVRFNTDGTAIFFFNAVQSGSTTLDITLVRTDIIPPVPETTKTITIMGTGRVNVQ